MNFLIRKWTSRPVHGDGWYLFRYNDSPPNEIVRIVYLRHLSQGLTEILHEAVGNIRFSTADGYDKGQFIYLRVAEDTTI